MGTLQGLCQRASSASGERPSDSPGLPRRSFRQKGKLLFEIDPRPFQAALDQAKGQLAQAEAQMANADINVKRDIPQAEAHAIPQSQLDNDTQSLLAAKAAVKADQAAVEQAALNFGLHESHFLDRWNLRHHHSAGWKPGRAVYCTRRGFTGESDQGLFSHQ